MISIHALLAESDTQSQIDARVIPISIHALLAESDALRSPRIALMVGFLSTLSLRRATDGGEASGKFLVFLSTLSLRRATPAGF